jgi:hypothetical protein
VAYTLAFTDLSTYFDLACPRTKPTSAHKPLHSNVNGGLKYVIASGIKDVIVGNLDKPNLGID